ncbi:hypothetical protein, partial [Rhodobium orientis]|uniref:hypothetical protein n=1 Tax=Rhodobium orientis TaxID=34017 RepID=UPI001AECCF15
KRYAVATVSWIAASAYRPPRNDGFINYFNVIASAAKQSRKRCAPATTYRADGGNGPRLGARGDG